MTSHPPSVADPHVHAVRRAASINHRIDTLTALTGLLLIGIALTGAGMEVFTGSATEAPPSYHVPVNTADQTSLVLLPNIGPALAQHIIADRTAHGPYHSTEQMQRVRGIGPIIARRIEPYVGFELERFNDGHRVPNEPRP